jgi:3-oxoacyl-[acyl-carrier-protein] synthase II
VTIVVTGLGAVTALGKTARETWERILTGERGLRELTLFDPGEVRTRIVAEVPVASPASRTVSRTSELALRAAREAIADAQLDVRSRRVGFVLGGTTAGMLETESVLATLLSTERARASGVVDAAREEALSRMLSHPLSAPTDRLVLELGPFARARSLSSACSSGANALAVGATWLELGLVDAVVCGGADSLCRVTLSGFNALGALDPNGARPFDVRRRGLTLGEGAAIMVLERAEDARARNKRVVCNLLGWASRSEAHHITNPEATGEAPLRAMQAALSRAGLTPADVDYVNAHGTGTPLNDPMETRALARLFGERLEHVPVSSQKGMIGHTLAAAGAIEAVITALAIEHGVMPPTGGLEEPDPECRLSHVLRATRRPLRAAISSSFGFGGMDTALVLGNVERAPVAAPRPAKRSVIVTGIAALTPAGMFVGEDVADIPERAGIARALVVELPPDALDADRARRLDRASQLAAVATGHALAQAGMPAGTSEDARRDVGIVLGIAFGAVDATAEFMRRLRDKGARMVRPAEFPSLVPSSPAGHVSIYHGLGGPAVVVADLAASGECAIAQASELIRAGDVDRVCAGGIEERSAIVEEVLSVVFGAGEPARRDVARREGGAILVLANADAERRPGERALARLGDIVIWKDPLGLPSELPPPPRGGDAIVVLGGMNARAEQIAAGSSWSRCPRIVCADVCGAHEATGGIAIAVAAAKVARGDAPAALFVGSVRGWCYAGTVWPATDRDRDRG